MHGLTGEGTLMRIHIGERDKHGGKPLHAAIVVAHADGFRLEQPGATQEPPTHSVRLTASEGPGQSWFLQSRVITTRTMTLSLFVVTTTRRTATRAPRQRSSTATM